MAVWNRPHNDPQRIKDNFARREQADRDRRDKENARMHARDRAKQYERQERQQGAREIKAQGLRGPEKHKKLDQYYKDFDAKKREQRQADRAKTDEYMQRYYDKRNGLHVFDPETNVHMSEGEYNAKQARQQRWDNKVANGRLTKSEQRGLDLKEKRAALEHHYKDAMFHSNTRDGNVADDRDKGFVGEWNSVQDQIWNGASYDDIFAKYGIDPKGHLKNQPVEDANAEKPEPEYYYKDTRFNRMRFGQ